MSEIEYHRSTNGRFVPAVNVKDDAVYWRDPSFTAFYQTLPERVIEDCYRNAIMIFWDQAKDIASQYGYGDVYSEGRSGGWLTVENPPELDPAAMDGDTPTRAQRKASDNNAAWEAFHKEILELMETCRFSEYRDMLEEAANERRSPVSRLMAREDCRAVGIK